MSEIRVVTHLRGHMASCNGRVELVEVRAEQCSLRGSESCLDIQKLQAKAEEIRKLKEERLRTFQRDVQERVQRRERTRQKQLLEATSRHVLKEQRPKAKTPGVRRKGRPAAVCEEVAVIVEPSTAVQRARLSLLAAASEPTPPPPPPHSLAPEHPTPVTPSQMTVRASSPPAPLHVERSAVRKYMASSQLALRQRQSHARQLHLFHRLYSDLEREATRQRRVRQVLRGSAERRRKESEIRRRTIEEDLEEEDSVLSEESCTERERERLEEWEQTVALERRRHQLQTARETERYVDALRGQLRERLASCPKPPPPLCSCGSTLWDTDPQTCANNCPFYRNPRAYATALGNLIATLKI